MTMEQPESCIQRTHMIMLSNISLIYRIEDGCGLRFTYLDYQHGNVTQRIRYLAQQWCPFVVADRIVGAADLCDPDPKRVSN